VCVCGITGGWAINCGGTACLGPISAGFGPCIGCLCGGGFAGENLVPLFL